MAQKGCAVGTRGERQKKKCGQKVKRKKSRGGERRYKHIIQKRRVRGTKSGYGDS